MHPVIKEKTAARSNFAFNLTSGSEDFNDSLQINIPVIKTITIAAIWYNVIGNDHVASTGDITFPRTDGSIKRNRK